MSTQTAPAAPAHARARGRRREPSTGRWLPLATAPWTRWTAFTVVALWAVYQQFWRLGSGNVVTDEPAYQQPGYDYLHGDFSDNRQHPPTAKYLMGLAQLVFGEGVPSARIAVAVLGLVTGVVLFVWLRRDVGWWTGLLAAGLWWLPPHGILDDPSRIDRLALLDGPMVAFGVIAMWCGWRWVRGGAWPWILAAGLAAGLSVTSKEIGVLLIPVFLVLPLLYRRWWGLLWGGLVFAAGFAVTVVVPYLPFGVVSTISEMIAFQRQHAADGHLVEVAGIITRHSPWWANLWYQWQGTGTLECAVLAVGVLAAFLIRPSRLVLWLALAAVPYFVFFLGVSDVALGEYYLAWMPMLVALAAIGIGRIATLRGPGWFRAAAFAAALAIVAVAATTSVRLSVATATMHPTGIGRLPEVLAETHREDGFVLAQRQSPSSVAAFVFKRQTRDPNAGPFDLVVIGQDDRYTLDPSIPAYVAAHPDEFRVFHLDDVEVLVPDGRLVKTAAGWDVVPR
ncbi:dolichyl-phosphate-mannose-protein mannosyltransferase [Curtobacterium sp. PhB130]|uniref:glycosyltransferase family 39 protein n=1 Tax=Curtobacterium sp. PhB130 TaxID=2485178 RepID=UPI000F4C6F93|nr:glycosyltransferase family 39 protein [Curtobacterium sp. PhB130]ROS77360.1 dolichyl-phosphate-mannose-protein mannosyltransferase [Curtobacterium sp. PhB130]